MGTLYIVGTPIGNMDDITLRALETLKSVDAIACEDTRHTGKLLECFNITKPLIRCDERVNYEQITKIVKLLKEGKSIGFVSDAGTPGVSDPGARLVNEAIKHNIKIVPIPGVSALTSLLSIAGLQDSKLLFLGFLPKKKGRETMFRSIKYQVESIKYRISIVVYESPYRVIRTIEDFAKIGDWNIVIGREMTKMFEEVIRGNCCDVINYFKKNPKKLKGEFSICLTNQE